MSFLKMSFNYNKRILRKCESELIFALLKDNIAISIPYKIELEMWQKWMISTMQNLAATY